MGKVEVKDGSTFYMRSIDKAEVDEAEPNDLPYLDLLMTVANPVFARL